VKRRDKYFLYFLMDGSLIVTTIIILLLLLLLIRHVDVDCRYVRLYKRCVRAFFFPLNPSGANRDLRLFSSFIDDIPNYDNKYYYYYY
jgi:hypothetical protein